MQHVRIAASDHFFGGESSVIYRHDVMAIVNKRPFVLITRPLVIHASHTYTHKRLEYDALHCGSGVAKLW